jgi:integrase/recombinase XerD
MPDPVLFCYRRHSDDCPGDKKGRDYTRCNCPVWVDGRIGRRRVHKSLKTRDWTLALSMLRDLESAPVSAPEPPKTLASMVEAYLAECRKNGATEATIKNYSATLNGLLESGATEFTLEALDKFRAGRDVKLITLGKELIHLRQLGKFAMERKWIAENPAKLIKPPSAKAIRRESPAKDPFTDVEVTRILEASTRIGNAPGSGHIDRARTRANVFIRVLLYTGLRISDVTRLERAALTDDNRLNITMKKTVEPILFSLEASAELRQLADDLRALPDEGPRFFWNSGLEATFTGNMARTLRGVFKLAKVKGSAHHLRDTFAVALLKRGVPIRTVSRLLGHASTAVTEKHYSKWMPDQQNMLDEALARLDFGSFRDVSVKGRPADAKRNVTPITSKTA